MGKVFEGEDFIIRTDDQIPENPPTGQLTVFAQADGLHTLTSAGVDKLLDASVTGASKIYRATLTGANGAFTSETVQRNDLSAAIAWAYTSEGVITGTLTDAFTANKTNVQLTLGSATGGVVLKSALTSNDAVVISSFLITDGTTAADFIGTIDVVITVEP
jgi:hypothetical protein